MHDYLSTVQAADQQALLTRHSVLCRHGQIELQEPSTSLEDDPDNCKEQCQQHSNICLQYQFTDRDMVGTW